MVHVNASVRVAAKEAYFEDNFEAALDLLAGAIKDEPTSADLYIDRAQVQSVSYMKMKKFDYAKESLQQALMIHDDKRTLSLLSECDARLKAKSVHLSALVSGVKKLTEDDTCTLTGSVNIEKSNTIDNVDAGRSKVSDFSAEEPAPVAPRQFQRTLVKQHDLDPAADNANITDPTKNYDDVAKENEDTGPKKVFIIYDNRMLEHRPKCFNDDESPQRIMKIVKKLEATNILRRCEVSTQAHKADLKYILAVHNEYIKAVQALSPKGRQPKRSQKYFSPDIVASKGTPQAAFLAAGAVIEARRRVASCGHESAFAIVRPPGHHAKAAFGSGFCFLNNISIAARYLQSEHNVSKILVVDFDVHRGDGTETIFCDDNSVMFCSIHRDDLFPNLSSTLKIGSGEVQGFNVNIGLEKGLKDGDMLAVFDYVFLPLAKQYKPDFVLVSAGFDAAENDPLGRSEVTPACFRELVWKLKSILNGKIVLALEGGYDLDALSESCAESLKALLDGRGPGFVKIKYEGVSKSTWDKIRQAYKELGIYWPSFAEGFKQPEDEVPDLT